MYNRSTVVGQPSPQIAIWEDDTPAISGACHSPSEALAVASDAAKEKAALGPKRSKWWRYHWLRQLDDDHRLGSVAARHRVHAGTVLRYIKAIGDYSNRPGTDPVFALRATLADRLGVSVATIGRARAAAIELGYHTQGEQLRWLSGSKPGTDPWCAGPSVVVLTMPEVASIATDPRGEEAAARIDARRRQRAERAAEAKRLADEQHRAWIESMIDDSEREAPQGRTVPTSAAEALAAARRSLSPP